MTKVKYDFLKMKSRITLQLKCILKTFIVCVALKDNVEKMLLVMLKVRNVGDEYISM